MEIDYIACQVDDSQVKGKRVTDSLCDERPRQSYRMRWWAVFHVLRFLSRCQVVRLTCACADWATWSQDNGILKLPPRNPYIPIDLSLCQGDEASPPAGVMFPAPTMVHDESGLRVWHRLTRAYRTPRAALMARLSSPAMSSSVQQRCRESAASQRVAPCPPLPSPRIAPCPACRPPRPSVTPQCRSSWYISRRISCTRSWGWRSTLGWMFRSESTTRRGGRCTCLATRSTSVCSLDECWRRSPL